MMNPQSILKGRIFENVLATAFKRARYKVEPLGVEHQFPDIDALTIHEYRNQLPEALRRLPDLMVYPWGLSEVNIHFIEVKYRAVLTENGVASLKDDLHSQGEYWPDSYCIIGLSEHPFDYNASKYHQNYMRAFQLDKLEAKPDEPDNFFGSGIRIPDLFPAFQSDLRENILTDEEGVEYAVQMEDLLDNAVQVLRSLQDFRG